MAGYCDIERKTECRKCDNKPELPVPVYPLIYYNFASVWERLITPILDHPYAQAISGFIVDEILEYVMVHLKLEESAVNLPWLTEIQKQLNVLGSRTEQRALVAKFGWGRFSPISDEDDEKMYQRVAVETNDDRSKLGYYLYLHNCELLSMLIWTWCTVLWPKKDWVIVSSSSHDFVMEATDPYTVYDI